MKCPACNHNLTNSKISKLAMVSATECSNCNKHLSLANKFHRWVMILLLFGLGVVVAYMAKADGGDFQMGRWLGFPIGYIAAMLYLNIFGSVKCNPEAT
jgi:hypothetical protein